MLGKCYPGWRVPRILLGFLMGMAVVARSLPAQEPPALPAEEAAQEPIPLHIGAYNFSGMGSFGYRFVDLNGSQAKYNQLFNLQQGFRVFDTQFNFLPQELNHGWFDRLSVTAQGLGGDPHPVIRMDLRKNGVYELRAGYRAKQYFYDLPETPFTPHRGWIDRRRFTDAELRYTPLRDLHLRFFYERTDREGSDLATNPFFFLPLAPGAWKCSGNVEVGSWPEARLGALSIEPFEVSRWCGHYLWVFNGVFGGIGGERRRGKWAVLLRGGGMEAWFPARSKPSSPRCEHFPVDRHTSSRRVEARAEGTHPSSLLRAVKDRDLSAFDVKDLYVRKPFCGTSKCGTLKTR